MNQSKILPLQFGAIANQIAIPPDRSGYHFRGSARYSFYAVAATRLGRLDRASRWPLALRRKNTEQAESYTQPYILVLYAAQMRSTVPRNSQQRSHTTRHVQLCVCQQAAHSARDGPRAKLTATLAQTLHDARPRSNAGQPNVKSARVVQSAW